MTTQNKLVNEQDFLQMTEDDKIELLQDQLQNLMYEDGYYDRAWGDMINRWKTEDEKELDNCDYYDSLDDEDKDDLDEEVYDCALQQVFIDHPEKDPFDNRKRFKDGSLVNGWTISTCGVETWYKDGLIHREDGPARNDYKEEIKQWYKDGEKHREGGPAVIYSDGTKEWWLEGDQYTEEDHKEMLKIKKMSIEELIVEMSF